jgi:K+-sensing histidine kinase KdpD
MGKLGTSNEGSTGIGLYLCRNIIEKPRTTYCSKWGQNKGAIFTISFKQ